MPAGSVVLEWHVESVTDYPKPDYPPRLQRLPAPTPLAEEVHQAAEDTRAEAEAIRRPIQ